MTIIDSYYWQVEHRCTGCNKIIASCTRYTKKRIFYFCNRSNRLIYVYVRWMRLCKTLIHQISRQLNTSCKCIRQIIHKFDKFHTVATKSGASRTPKVTEYQKRLIKFQQVRDGT